MSVLSTLFATFLGVLANYFGAVYKAGDLNNIFHPDADYLMYINFFTLINVGGAFILGLLFLFIKMFQQNGSYLIYHNPQKTKLVRTKKDS